MSHLDRRRGIARALRHLAAAAALALGVSGGAAHAADRLTCPTPTAPLPRTASQLTAAEKQKVIDLVNDARDAVKPAASPRLGHVTWNDQLAEEAQHWADELARDPNLTGHDPCYGVGWDAKGGAGENLAASSARDVAGMVQAWVDERDHNFRYTLFPNTNIPTAANQPTAGRLAIPGSGHYLQLAWQTTTSVGCGISSRANPSGNGQTEWLLFCRNNPDGNRCHQYPWKTDGADVTPGIRAGGNDLGSCANAPTPSNPYGEAAAPTGSSAGTGTPPAAPTAAAPPAAEPDIALGSPADTCGNTLKASSPMGPALLDALNCARRNLGKPGFQWDDTLAAAAQASANGRNDDANYLEDEAAPGATEVIAASFNSGGPPHPALLIYHGLINNNEDVYKDIKTTAATRVGCGWAEKPATINGKAYFRRLLVCRFN